MKTSIQTLFCIKHPPASCCPPRPATKGSVPLREEVARRSRRGRCISECGPDQSVALMASLASQASPHWPHWWSACPPVMDHWNHTYSLQSIYLHFLHL